MFNASSIPFSTSACCVSLGCSDWLRSSIVLWVARSCVVVLLASSFVLLLGSVCTSVSVVFVSFHAV